MKFEILKMRDKTDSFYTKKNDLFDLPFRLAVVGKSFLSGKTTLIMNLLLREKYYKNDFLGENIYIISNNKADNKIKILMEEKDVPDVNHMSYDESHLMCLYEYLEEQFIQTVEDDEKPPNILIYIDDVGYSSAIKNNSGFMNLLACNSRHLNISVVVAIQKYTTQLSTTYRNNLSGLIVFNTSTKEALSIAEDHNYNHETKNWMKAFRENTKEKNSFFVVNYSNEIDKRYMDKNFKPIKIE